MITSAPSAIKWIDDMGVVFSRFSDGKIAQPQLGGASSKRSCYAQDYTGLKILHSLYDTATSKDIKFFNEYMLLDLVVENNQILGVNALEIQNSKIVDTKYFENIHEHHDEDEEHDHSHKEIVDVLKRADLLLANLLGKHMKPEIENANIKLSCPSITPLGSPVVPDV